MGLASLGKTTLAAQLSALGYLLIFVYADGAMSLEMIGVKLLIVKLLRERS